MESLSVSGPKQHPSPRKLSQPSSKKTSPGKVQCSHWMNRLGEKFNTTLKESKESLPYSQRRYVKNLKVSQKIPRTPPPMGCNPFGMLFWQHVIFQNCKSSPLRSRSLNLILEKY